LGAETRGEGREKNRCELFGVACPKGIRGGSHPGRV